MSDIRHSLFFYKPILLGYSLPLLLCNFFPYGLLSPYGREILPCIYDWKAYYKLESKFIGENRL